MPAVALPALEEFCRRLADAPGWPLRLSASRAELAGALSRAWAGLPQSGDMAVRLLPTLSATAAAIGRQRDLEPVSVICGGPAPPPAVPADAVLLGFEHRYGQWGPWKPGALLWACIGDGRRVQPQPAEAPSPADAAEAKLEAQVEALRRWQLALHRLIVQAQADSYESGEAQVALAGLHASSLALGRLLLEAGRRPAMVLRRHLASSARTLRQHTELAAGNMSLPDTLRARLQAGLAAMPLPDGAGAAPDVAKAAEDAAPAQPQRRAGRAGRAPAPAVPVEAAVSRPAVRSPMRGAMLRAAGRIAAMPAGVRIAARPDMAPLRAGLRQRLLGMRAEKIAAAPLPLRRAVPRRAGRLTAGSAGVAAAQAKRVPLPRLRLGMRAALLRHAEAPADAATRALAGGVTDRAALRRFRVGAVSGGRPGIAVAATVSAVSTVHTPPSRAQTAPARAAMAASRVAPGQHVAGSAAAASVRTGRQGAMAAARPKSASSHVSPVGRAQPVEVAAKLPRSKVSVAGTGALRGRLGAPPLRTARSVHRNDTVPAVQAGAATGIGLSLRRGALARVRLPSDESGRTSANTQPAGAMRANGPGAALARASMARSRAVQAEPARAMPAGSGPQRSAAPLRRAGAAAPPRAAVAPPSAGMVRPRSAVAPAMARAARAVSRPVPANPQSVSVKSAQRPSALRSDSAPPVPGGARQALPRTAVAPVRDTVKPVVTASAPVAPGPFARQAARVRDRATLPRTMAAGTASRQAPVPAPVPVAVPDLSARVRAVVQGSPLAVAALAHSQARAALGARLRSAGLRAADRAVAAVMGEARLKPLMATRERPMDLRAAAALPGSQPRDPRADASPVLAEANAAMAQLKASAPTAKAAASTAPAAVVQSPAPVQIAALDQPSSAMAAASAAPATVEQGAALARIPASNPPTSVEAAGLAAHAAVERNVVPARMPAFDLPPSVAATASTGPAAVQHRAEPMRAPVSARPPSAEGPRAVAMLDTLPSAAPALPASPPAALEALCVPVATAAFPSGAEGAGGVPPRVRRPRPR